MSWYRAGSVTLTPGSTAVIGTGTAFIANCRVGDAFLAPNGAVYEITNIASDTALSIYPPYASETAYAVGPMQGYDKLLADKAGAILEQWGSTLAGLGDVSSQDVVPIEMGGTGAVTALAARTALGLGGAATRNVGTGAGNLLERGAFGLGTTYAQGLTFVANMTGGPDNLGFYGYSASTVGAPTFGSGYGGFLNMPITSDGSGAYGAQLALDYNTPTVCVRKLAGGIWSSWAKLYHSANTTVAADGTLKAI